jgi:hypothetical protein
MTCGVLAQWLRDCAALEDVGDDPTKPSRGSLADMTEPLPVKMPEKVPVKVPGSFPARVAGYALQDGHDLTARASTGRRLYQEIGVRPA